MASTPFATPDDLAGLWRPLSEAERPVAGRLLRVASAIIRTHVPSVDARLEAGTLDRELPAFVAVAMVRRLLSNPEGVRQQSAGPLQVTYATTEVHGLAMTTSEIALLAPSRTALAGTVMTVPGLRGCGRRV